MLDHLRHPDTGGQSPHDLQAQQQEQREARQRVTPGEPLPEEGLARVVLGHRTYLSAGGALFGPVFDCQSWNEAEAAANHFLRSKAMIAKTFEVLDRCTFIPVLAVKLQPSNEADRYLLARAGYGRTPEKQAEYVQVSLVNGGQGYSACDPWEWSQHYGETMPPAHQYIIDHFDELESGAVVDAQFIRGESAAPKVSEAVA